MEENKKNEELKNVQEEISNYVDAQANDLVKETSSAGYEIDEFRHAIYSLDREQLEKLLETLPKSEEVEILKKRSGLYDGEPKTYDEIGRMLGVTRENKTNRNKGINKIKTSKLFKNGRRILEF